jgi:Tol biopolymer transport system component
MNEHIHGRIAAHAAGLAFLLALVAPGARAGSGEEATLIRNARQLVFEGKRSGEGYFSPDGKNLVFQSEREAGNPFYQIYILSLESGESHRVSGGTGKTTCAYFQPGTERVLYASTHLDPDAEKKQEEEIALRASGKERRYAWDYDAHFDIFSCGRGGGDIVRLTEAPGYDAEGAYSPDGKRIVFCSMRDAYPVDALSQEDRERVEVDPSYFGEIYTMNADGSDPKRLTDWPGYDGGPFFTPDGTRIVWRHFTEDGAMADIYTMAADGSDKRRLTDFASMCWAPYFHPSGAYAIFTTNKHGFSNFELYLVDAAGVREPVRVTHTDGFDGLPVFSPDGKRLSWTATRTADGKAQIFIGDWNHDAARAALDAAGPRHEVDSSDAALGRRWPVAGYAAREASGTESDGGGISADALRATVAFLAADDLEGRLTGSKGERKAGEYIAERFARAGLEPLGDDGYFQGFPFTSGVTVIEEDNRLEITDASGAKHAFAVGMDFRPLAFSENAEIEGELVFAGYGLTMPGDEQTSYDSYAEVDVTGKIVLALRYVPEDVDTERRAELNVYAGLRYKAMLARENGAKAMLVVIGPNSPNAGELVPLRFDQALAGSGIPVISVTAAVADLLFSGYEKQLGEVQDGLDQENPHVPGHFDLPGARVKMATALRRETDTGRNVIGYLPPTGGGEDGPVIVVGAHYDHIGRGDIGSLARKGEEGMVHNGADDNASGTSVVLALAEALAARPEKPAMGIVFAAWSGEEMGIIGSNYFMQHPPVAMDRIAAYLNFDMVGRLRDNTLMLQGVGSSNTWKKHIEKRNVAAGFNAKLSDDPYLPTDVTAFYPKGVPVLSFFTGSHEEYNRPADDAETLDYEGMERIARFAEGIVADVAAGERPQYVEVPRSKERSGSRGSLRAYLGTIPDYAGSDVEGVKLSGVRAGGPADKAGLQGGDIIVEFGGREVKNIYDYTYALDAVKIGQPVEVVVLRDGERVTLTVVPEARK